MMLLEVSDNSHVAAARRTATTLAQRHGMDESAAGRVALVATEIATNLLKHGKGGRIALDSYADSSGSGVELIAMDEGDGIANIAEAFGNGFSTAGTAGNGLGIMERQTDLLTLFSRPTMGTVLVARIAARTDNANGPGNKKTTLGAVVDPYPGETECGDGWAFAETAHGPTLLLADGSGHGAMAKTAAQTAVTIFRDNSEEPLPRIMELIHKGLFSTRGAAVGIARIDRSAKLVRYVGVGNIVGAVLLEGEVKRMVSHNGTTGMVAPRINEFTYPSTLNPTVVLHSDGLTAKWDLNAYPGVYTAHPSVIAGLLFRDFKRGKDDASVVAMRSAIL